MKFTSEGLVNAGMQLVAPFTVSVRLDPDAEVAAQGGESLGAVDLGDGETSLAITRVLRVLPGRRVSGIARVGDTEVFAKIFVGPGARRYWQRELLGAQRLSRAEVASPQLLARGAVADGFGYVVCYELLADPQSLDPNDTVQVLAAVRLLAQMHEAGVVQSDVHVQNFIYRDGGVYAVDADGVRRGHLLRHHFANLGMFLAQRSPLCDVDVSQVWHTYSLARGEYVQKMGSAEQLREMTERQRSARVARYLRKTQRACTEFVQRSSFRDNWLCDRDHWPKLQRFSLFPEEYLSEGTPLKLGNSATVVRIEVEGTPYVVKRYNIKSFTHRLRRWFKRRARLAWMNGHHLAFLEIPTAKPIALLEQRWFKFVGVCYLVMPDVGERHLGQMLDPNEESFPGIVARTIALLKCLAAAKLEHGDLKATNFVVRGGDVVLIDYDALRRGPNTDDLKRFLRNWESQADLMAAWRGALEEADL